jgi:DNA-directed RNA polymerase subunit RPC12/RpoP
MKISNKKEWIDIIKQLETDRQNKIACPECSHQFLQVQDVELEGWGKCERNIRCENCKAMVAVVFDIPKQDKA